ncbi:hypothetical protein [Streptomyces litchfieldiae]|uniref:Knr4/Smi1-like domain-containing protein n=1 Tax=Streptomyces litchfieldiae TaxID=3075543 RepID=A0ABU2MQJ8_9ACTN|nr:hypothetical protein [Streptomyces sp. DSM 44938]MDT0343893.1 hypothetical protein [Streptomyces sp. DSM 44938]
MTARPEGSPLTTPELSPDWLTAWQRGITGQLDRALALFERAHGYPPGDNEVPPADDTSRAAVARPMDTTELPPDLVLDHLTAYGPVRIADRATGIVFGSDGGGILFAIDHDGRVHRSATASWSDDFQPIVPSLAQFLERLHRAVADLASSRRGA